MPSLDTRRRRAGASELMKQDLLEGGGNRGQATVDSSKDTEDKLKKYAAQESRQNQMAQRAHLVAFPLFLFGLLAIFSHSLHLSFLSCVFIPMALGLLLFLGSAGIERAVGAEKGAQLVAENGKPFLFLLVLFTIAGLALSQLFFRDKLGKPLL